MCAFAVSEIAGLQKDPAIVPMNSDAAAAGESHHPSADRSMGRIWLFQCCATDWILTKRTTARRPVGPKLPRTERETDWWQKNATVTHWKLEKQNENLTKSWLQMNESLDEKIFLPSCSEAPRGQSDEFSAEDS